MIPEGGGAERRQLADSACPTIMFGLGSLTRYMADLTEFKSDMARAGLVEITYLQLQFTSKKFAQRVLTTQRGHGIIWR